MATTWEYWRAADTYAAQHGGDYNGFMALGPQTSGGPLAAGQQAYLDQFTQWYNTPASGPFQNLWQAAMVAAGITSDPQYLPATLTAYRDQAQQLTQQAGLPIGQQAAPAASPSTTAPPPAYAPPASAPATTAPTAPATVAPLGTAGTTAQPTTALLPGDQTLFGPIVGTGDTGLPQGLGEEWHALFGQEMLSLMNATGQVVDPRTGAPLTNPDGTPMSTQAALAQAAQIAAQQASTKFAQAALTGTIDGQPTLDAQRIQAQASQFAQQMSLSQAQLQAQISQFTQGFSLQQAAVTGTYGGAPTEQAREFGQTLAEQQRQFDTAQSGYLGGQPTIAAQQLLAANLADPTRTVQGAYLASQFGTARSGQAGISGPSGTPGYPTAYGASGGVAGGGAAQGSQGWGVNVNVSPEVQSYFAGDPFATPRGQGQSVDLGALSGYAFKQAPSAYNALSATGRAQVGSFNQALTGQNPADYADMIARQLPKSPSSLPAAYSV